MPASIFPKFCENNSVLHWRWREEGKEPHASHRDRQSQDSPFLSRKQRSLLGLCSVRRPPFLFSLWQPMGIERESSMVYDETGASYSRQDEYKGSFYLSVQDPWSSFPFLFAHRFLRMRFDSPLVFSAQWVPFRSQERYASNKRACGGLERTKEMVMRCIAFQVEEASKKPVDMTQLTTAMIQFSRSQMAFPRRNVPKDWSTLWVR